MFCSRRNFKQITLTINFHKTTCQFSWRHEIVSIGCPFISIMISIGIKIEPSDKLALCICYCIPSMFLNYTSGYTSKIVIMGSYFCPSLFPCSSFAAWSEVISVITKFNHCIFINDTITVRTIVSTVGSFLKLWLKNITIAIKQICRCICTKSCSYHATFIIFTHICRITSHLII